jgi:glutathione reductase (NADPH)
MTGYDYDLIAIGGGSGGLALAQRAAEYGARSAVVECGALGGACVNVGCVPKKIMWNAANLMYGARDAAAYAIEMGEPRCDWAGFRARRDAYIARLRGIYARNLERRSVPLHRGFARFLDAHTLDVDGATLRAARVVIATGSRPAMPRVPGVELGITSDEFFELEAIPRRVAVIGSGYIAVEIAGVMNAFSDEVTLFVRRDAILRDFDPMIQAALAREMAASGMAIRSGVTPAALEPGDAGTRTLVAADGNRFGPFDLVVWAIGREPVLDALNLEGIGVARDERGFVVVDPWQATSVADVFAIGDVTGHAMHTPVAIAAGRRLADRLYGGQADRHLDYSNIPAVVFSHPPVGTVGLTEPQARERHEQVEVKTSNFVSLYHALLPGERPRCDMKLVLAGAEQRVVGCHIVGVGADEMLQGFAVAIRMGATLRDFQDTVAIHPTGAEELVTMR